MASIEMLPLKIIVCYENQKHLRKAEFLKMPKTQFGLSVCLFDHIDKAK